MNYLERIKDIAEEDRLTTRSVRRRLLSGMDPSWNKAERLAWFRSAGRARIAEDPKEHVPDGPAADPRQWVSNDLVDRLIREHEHRNRTTRA